MDFLCIVQRQKTGILVEDFRHLDLHYYDAEIPEDTFCCERVFSYT